MGTEISVNPKQYSLKDAYKIAKSYINRHGMVHWDDLADTNSLWDYLDESMTMNEIHSAAKEAYIDRVGGDDAAEITGVSGEEVWSE